MHITSLSSYTWQLAELLVVFTHFMFTNLPQCNQSINSLIYVYSPQIPSCFYECLITFVITVLRTTAAPPQKKFLYYPLVGDHPFKIICFSVRDTLLLLKGATKKLYFMYCSCVVIILFSPGLYKAAFSTYSLVKLVFHLFVFFVFLYLWLLIFSFALC